MIWTQKLTRFQKFSSQIQKQRVVIIGAGVIGVTTAFRLLEEGYNVTLIEKEKESALHSSYFNGCVFTPVHFQPQVTKEYFLQFMLSLFKKDSNVSFNLNIVFEKHFWLWMFNAFQQGMPKNKQLVNANKLIDLGKLSQVEYIRYKAAYPQFFADQQNFTKGQFKLFKTEEEFQGYKAKLDQFEIPYKIIHSVADLHQYDPLLVNKSNEKILSNYFASILVPNETCIDTRNLTLNILNECRTYKDNFQEIYNCEVLELIKNENNINSIKTNKNQISGDKFVIANSLWSKYICEQLNIRIPILPVRGWAVSIPDSQTKEQKSILQVFNVWVPNFLTTNINGYYRLSGIGEVKKYVKSSPSDWGFDYLIKQFNLLSKIPVNRDDCKFHSCYRPVTPDDSPIICRLPHYNNLYINVGHGSRGLTQSFASAQIITELIQNHQKNTDKWENYNLNRFTGCQK